MTFKSNLKRVLPESLRERYEGMKLAVRQRREAAVRPEDYPVHLAQWFRDATGEELDLENPVTFNQKVQWMKLYDSTPEKGRLADKYLVREYVAERIGDQYLVPLLGVWDNPDDIDFDALPERFVLKATHGCGWNVIVRDKAKLDVKATRRKLRRWLETDYSLCGGLELHYRYCQPRIVAEQFLENTPGEHSDLYDYKFWCFGGRVEYVQFLEDRSRGLKMSFFDREWRRQPFVYSYPRDRRDAPMPGNLEEMIGLAERLAEGMPHVRADFYRLDDGKLYFGELTFTSMGGICAWDPPETNLMMGALVELPPRETGQEQGIER